MKLSLIPHLSQTTKRLEGYSLIRSDHPSNTKGGGVYIYYKESLIIRLVDITFLLERLVCEVTIRLVDITFLPERLVCEVTIQT